MHARALRVATAGSVDDGKSTLIGRLLHDTKTILEDQWRAVEKASRRWGGELNLALLSDGLRAEREQGITIDVAHRYFATPRRSFILADSPGHAQYTRNMVTAASTADVAIVLVDVRHGVTEQTRRHAYIAALVGVEQLVLAVNKMDLVDWDPDRFDAVVAELRSYLDALPTPAPPLHVLPVSALHGDNVVAPSERAPWYDGPPLLSLLEEADTRRAADVGARLDVQWCIRHPPADFRAIAGRLSGAPLRVGDDVTIAPSGTRTRVGAIARGGRSAEFAGPGQAITVTFTDHVDVARGDVVLGPLGAGTMPVAVTELDADLCWMTEAPLVPGARMRFKHGTRTGTATVTRIEHRVDVTTLVREAADELRLNDLARVRLSLASSIVALPYRQHQEAGRLVLIDPADHSTAAAAMIHGFCRPERARAQGPPNVGVMTTTSVALVVKLVAKSDTADEVAEFLSGAVELANAEAGTPVWFALRSDETTFWIVDAFPGDTERQAHLNGPIAAALMENADRLLAEPPEIRPADVLASKIP